MRVVEVFVEGNGSVEISLVGHFANTLVHWQLREKIVERLLVVHGFVLF